MIYFIQAGNEAVKIGFALNNVKERCKNLQTAHYKELKIIHQFDGNIRREKEIHFVAKKHHIRGEWFDKKILKDKQLIRALSNNEPIRQEPKVKSTFLEHPTAEYLSTAEAAKRLGCSRQYIWSLIKMGRLKAKKVGNVYGVYEKDINGMIKDKK